MYLASAKDKETYSDVAKYPIKTEYELDDSGETVNKYIDEEVKVLAAKVTALYLSLCAMYRGLTRFNDLYKISEYKRFILKD